MTPGYYKGMYFMLRELSIRAVEAMPADDMTYQPPNSRSAGEIALHVAETDYTFTNALTGREDKPNQPLTMENYPTQAAIVALLREGQKRTTAIIDSLSLETLARVVKAPIGGDGPAEMWLSILLVHESDHKGNLVMMAKVLGGNPPDVSKVRELLATAN